MKKFSFIIATLFLLSISGCKKEKEESTESAVTKALTTNSECVSQFPKTLDIDSCLNIYAAGATIFSNGQEESMKDIKSAFEKMKEDINLGNPIGLSSKVSNIKIQDISKGFSLATYESDFKSANSGVIAFAVKMRCTALMAKGKLGWQIKHEHCSDIKSQKNNAAS